MKNQLPKQRTIRSYVKREGRITQAQRQALEQGQEQYGLMATSGFYDWSMVFGRNAACILDIGYGSGDSLLALAKKYPEHNIIGIEVHRPGIGHVIAEAKKQDLSNVKTFMEDANTVLTRSIQDASIDKIYLLFPDPWQKKRHHKRRLIQTGFIELLLTKLKPEGILHIATDWQHYAEHITNTLATFTTIKTLSPTASWRATTKYEKRGIMLGHTVTDFVVKKIGRSEGKRTS